MITSCSFAMQVTSHGSVYDSLLYYLLVFLIELVVIIINEIHRSKNSANGAVKRTIANCDDPLLLVGRSIVSNRQSAW